tara:strand:- start:43 stop:1143 length:1101 start_codon:yes stop_codon:yes gene_type:complete
MIRVKPLSISQEKTVLKLFESDAISSKGNLLDVGKTPSWLSIKKGINKNKLIQDLPILSDYSLVESKSKPQDNAQNWNYYGLTEIGQWYAIKKQLEDLEIKLSNNVINSKEYTEEMKRLLITFKDTMPVLITNHDELEKFGTMYYFSLAQIILSFEFFIRNEKYIPFELFVLTLSLPSDDGFGSSKLESWYPILSRVNEIDDIAVKQNLENLGIVNLAPLKKKMSELDDRVGEKIKEVIEEDIRKYLTFGFFYFLTRNVSITKDTLVTFHNKTKNIKKARPEFDVIKQETLDLGRELLRAFDRHSTGLDIEAIIEELEQVQKDIEKIINKKGLSDTLKKTQREINEKKNSSLFSKKVMEEYTKKKR